MCFVLDDKYNNGFRAFNQNRRRESNPFKEQRKRDSWWRGWDAAYSQRGKRALPAPPNYKRGDKNG